MYYFDVIGHVMKIPTLGFTLNVDLHRELFFDIDHEPVPSKMFVLYCTAECDDSLCTMYIVGLVNLCA